MREGIGLIATAAGAARGSGSRRLKLSLQGEGIGLIAMAADAARAVAVVGCGSPCRGRALAW